MKIGKGLKTLLKEKSISQKELAKRIDISETSISLIIQDRTQPRKETIELISNELNIKPELLFILSIEQDDIPESKRNHYEILWPTIKSSLLTLLND